MNPKRKKVEALAYRVYDALDDTGSNSDYWKKTFAKMSDAQFNKFLSKKFPFHFQMRPFEIDPDLGTIQKALDILKVPMTEKISLPFLYRNSNGEPIWSKESFVGYTHLRKPKQFITKKNHLSLNIDNRDMKSGQLLGDDKGARQSDREFESLQVMGLDNTTMEFSKIKADSMDLKNQAYNQINLTGDIKLSDLNIDSRDSLSKNMISAYLIASHLQTNLVNSDYMLPSTIKNKSTRIERK